MAYQEEMHRKEGFQSFLASTGFWNRILKSPSGSGATVQSTGFRGALNFEVTGKAGGQFHLAVEDGSAALEKGAHSSPKGTITLPDELFMRLLSGVASWATVYSSGQVQASGDVEAKAAGALFGQLKSARGGSGPSAWAARWLTNRVIKKSGVVREAH